MDGSPQASPARISLKRLPAQPSRTRHLAAVATRGNGRRPTGGASGGRRRRGHAAASHRAASHRASQRLGYRLSLPRLPRHAQQGRCGKIFVVGREHEERKVWRSVNDHRVSSSVRTL